MEVNVTTPKCPVRFPSPIVEAGMLDPPDPLGQEDAPRWSASMRPTLPGAK